MKLERGLKHQDDAVNSIIRVFENVEIPKTKSLTANPIIDLQSPNIIKNIKKIQEHNNISREMKSNVGVKDNYLNIDIKMETGTGKTFTQIKTIYELNAKYGFNKFIIVVPTLPIKAGTKQFIQSKDTKIFFEDEYNNVELELRLVESIKKKKGREYFPSVIREFVTSSNLNTKKIQVMLINAHLITNGTMLTKDYDTTILDDLTNPSEAIKSTHPIILIDEPHKFDKNNIAFKKIKEYFSPQCIIRFGATFPEKRTKGKIEHDYHNLIYNLSSIDAFNKNLVKGVYAEYVPTRDNIRIKLVDVKSKEKCTVKKIEEDKTKTYELFKNDSLSIVHEDFDGVEITGITNNSILLSNGVEAFKNSYLSPESSSMSYQDMMIETALERHFGTEKENFKRGIKTLALFFIDDISSYRKKDDKPAYLLESFDRILKDKLKKNILEADDDTYREYLKQSLAEIPKCRAAYFSEDKSNKDEDIQKEVDDILNEKEKILKIYENKQFNLRRFIFSKWTLKEGWDNPNIFTIAKLRNSGSENSKLQEVGRGLRLPVDNNLNRIAGEQFYLNYIVDFTEKDFITDLKREVNKEAVVFDKVSTEQILEVAKQRNVDENDLWMHLMTERIIDFSGKILDEEKFFNEIPELNSGLKRDKIINRKEKEENKIGVRKEKYEKIRKLWELLNQKYIINYSKFSDDEITTALVGILEKGIDSYDEIVTQRQMLNVNDNTTTITEMSGISLMSNTHLKYNDFLIKVSVLTNIPITNIHNALVMYNEKHKINSEFFNKTVLSKLCDEINNWKAKELFKRFTYKKTNLPIHPTKLTNEKGELKDTIVLGNVGTSKIEGTPQERYLYDTIAFDSDIEKNNIMEEIQEVTVFGKIPKNSIKIPVANGGTYSPDFMYLVDKKDGSSELNLIIESKNYESDRDLSKKEDYKIDCAKKLFKQLENEGIKIKFEKQLSTAKVGTIVRNLIK